MDVRHHHRRATERVRATSPTPSGGGLRAFQQIISLKGGNLFVKSIRSSSCVRPGGTVDVGVTVSNGATLICNSDPDCCGPACGPYPFGGCTLTNGYEFELIVDPDWTTSETRRNCIKTTEAGEVNQEYSFDFPAPSREGNPEIEITLRATGSGVEGSVTESVQIDDACDSRPGTGQCVDAADCADNEACVDGRCVPLNGGGGGGGGGGDSSLKQIQNILLLAIVAIVLVNVVG